MKFLSLALCLLALTTGLSTTNVYAQTVYDVEYQTIGSVELVEITDDGDSNLNDLPLMNPNALKSAPVDEMDMVLMKAEKMIALGEKIYAIAKKGEPVVSVKTTPVSVLPADEKGNLVSAFNLENWQFPKTKKYRISYKNLYGITTVKFEFMLIFTYGGSLNGKGHYITAAQIVPTTLNVLWGYTFDASFSVQSITNQGSADSPVAAAVLMMDYRVKTVLQETNLNKTFYINGLGQVTSL